MTEEFNIPSGPVENYSDFCPCEHTSWSQRKMCHAASLLPGKGSETELGCQPPRTLLKAQRKLYYLSALPCPVSSWASLNADKV